MTSASFSSSSDSRSPRYVTHEIHPADERRVGDGLGCHHNFAISRQIPHVAVVEERVQHGAKANISQVQSDSRGQVALYNEGGPLGSQRSHVHS